MNFEQLKYIIDISKTSSLNMTAENMFLTQPAITKSIKTLETELNCVLLKRSKKGVKLTEEGQYFLQYAEKIINLHSEMMQHFNNDEKNLCGNFKIGTASNIAEIFLMDVLFMMQEHYSNFKISSFDLEPEEMFSFLFNNQLDYGFFLSPSGGAG